MELWRKTDLPKDPEELDAALCAAKLEPMIKNRCASNGVSVVECQDWVFRYIQVSKTWKIPGFCGFFKMMMCGDGLSTLTAPLISCPTT